MYCNEKTMGLRTREIKVQISSVLQITCQLCVLGQVT